TAGSGIPAEGAAGSNAPAGSSLPPAAPKVSAAPEVPKALPSLRPSWLCAVASGPATCGAGCDCRGTGCVWAQAVLHAAESSNALHIRRGSVRPARAESLFALLLLLQYIRSL